MRLGCGVNKDTRTCIHVYITLHYSTDGIYATLHCSPIASLLLNDHAVMANTAIN